MVKEKYRVVSPKPWVGKSGAMLTEFRDQTITLHTLFLQFYEILRIDQFGNLDQYWCAQ